MQKILFTMDYLVQSCRGSICQALGDSEVAQQHYEGALKIFLEGEKSDPLAVRTALRFSVSLDQSS